MHSYHKTALVFCLGLAAAAAGCSKKSNADAELDKAAKAMEQPDPAQPQATAAAAAPAPAAPAPAAPANAPEPPAQQMNQAMTAYKGGNLEDAVTRFQRLRASPALTPQQRMALQDAMAAVMTDIYSLAAKGDARAKAAIKQYEALQNSHQGK